MSQQEKIRGWINCTAINCQGLHASEGLYAKAVGALKPFILVDPLIRTKDGQTACIFHEACHVIWRHLFTSRVLFYISLVCPPIFVVWIFFQRWIERAADDFALENTWAPSPPGKDPAREFRAFCWMHPHPKGRWGRWCYGSSATARLERALLKYMSRHKTDDKKGMECVPGT